MACEGNYNKIPININKANIKRLSKNLSQFKYDMKNISKIDITADKNFKGVFSIDNINQKAVAFMPTLGKLELMVSIFYMNSVNQYNGKHADMEIILAFKNKNDKWFLMFIPIKKENISSKSSKWFSQFVSNIEPNKTTQTIGVNFFNFNDIVPQDSFISYKSTMPYLTGCNIAFDMIFFEKTLNINKDDYETLETLFGKNNYKNLTNIAELNNTDSNYTKNSKNYIIKKINGNNATFDYRGTKNGPGLKSSNETLPLICTPVEDEKGDPISGKNRLDWIKGTFEGISPDVKNILYVILIAGILIGAMVFVHSFVFKNLGKILGDESIVTRSSSLI